jgi:hypothetical protein
MKVKVRRHRIPIAPTLALVLLLAVSFYLLFPYVLASLKIAAQVFPSSILIAVPNLGLRESIPAWSLIFGPEDSIVQTVSSLDPYIELFGIRQFFLICLALGFPTLLWVIFWAIRAKHLRRFSRPFVALTAFSLFLISFAISGILSLSAVRSNAWDETFLFVTQIKSVASGLGNVVSITGARGSAEASADTGAIWMAGALVKIMGLDPLASLVIVCTLGVGILAALVFLFVYYGTGKPVLSVAVGSIVGVSSGPLLAAGSAGFPVAWTSVAVLALFASGFLLPQRFRLQAVSICGVLAFFIRPDLFLLGAFLVLAQSFLHLRRRESSWRDVRLRLLIFPLGFFAVIGVVTCLRILRFGSPLPSGILGKSSGLHADHIMAGLDRLGGVSASMYLSLIVAIPAVVLLWTFWRTWTGVFFGSAVLIAVAPGIIGGGDFFPDYWARYFMPIVVVLVVFALIALASNRQYGNSIPKLGLAAREARFLQGAIVVVLLIGNLGGIHGQKVWNDRTLDAIALNDLPIDGNGDSWALRPICLARAGAILGLLSPDQRSIGTTEINSLAFFAGASLTDLLGIVDSRSALAPYEPMYRGNWAYKRHNPGLITEDRPMYLYQSDSISCSQGEFAYGVSRFPVNSALQLSDAGPLSDEIQRLTGDASFWYRFGDRSEILKSYTPVNIDVGGGTSLLILVNNGDLPAFIQRATSLGALASEWQIELSPK